MNIKVTLSEIGTSFQTEFKKNNQSFEVKADTTKQMFYPRFEVDNREFSPEIGVDNREFRAELGEILQVGTGRVLPTFSGPYEVTPTEETQTLLTNGKRLTENVIVAPIPPQYGRVTYDNTRTLTVS